MGRRQVHTLTVSHEYGNHGIMVGWRWSRGLPEFSQCALGTVDMREEVGSALWAGITIR